MSKKTIEFDLDIKIDIFEQYFEDIIAQYVSHHQQKNTMGVNVLNAVMLGIKTASIMNLLSKDGSIKKNGRTLQIPINASLLHNNGSMSVTISNLNNIKTRVMITGHISSWAPDKLSEHIDKVKDFLVLHVPECLKEYKQKENIANNDATNEVDKLNSLFNLFKQGAITEAEFNRLKEQIIK